MLLKVVKNTVLLLLLVTLSCGNSRKLEVGSSEKEVFPDKDSSTALSVTTQDSKDILVGANQTQLYLPLLEGKRVGVVANQTSVIFKKSYYNKLLRYHFAKDKNAYPNKPYSHLVDSLLSRNVNIKKVFAPEHGFRGTADAGELVKMEKTQKLV